MTTPNELKSLRDKMRALQSGDYDVEAENPKIVRCWERLNCDKKDCPAYGKIRCWSIAGTCCHGEVRGKYAQKIKDCRECVVYKESCGDDIGELIEAFNLMVKDVRHNFAERVRSDQEKANIERLSQISDMVAGVAHETRNPLHSIGMATSFLKKKYQDEMMSEFLGIIEEEVKKLNKLTSIFLDFSNPSPLNLQTCSINEVIDLVIDEYAGQAKRQKIAIQLNLDKNLPEFISDKSRLHDLFSCLLENALEISVENNRITVSTERKNKMICLSVQDEGPGIATADQEKIFKPFYTTKMNGPGLGLAIVERSVKELKGMVEVESTPGKGATFTVCIPVMD
ncbi:MAG TPA: GHKL domain-containing protein [Salinimicrobium catena]|uniref:histidine kinase n=1 Tax=Salinimicrobium catena TaxID=390640 RepID=A0A7C2M522_9FLAO|nr:GHKL domain-containing protein [Salinimicrobium catena]